MRIAASLVLFVAISATRAVADPSPAPAPSQASADAAASEVSRPVWVRTPDGNSFIRYYPEAAVGRVAEARVVLMCAVSHDGHLDPCKVTFENPTGYGFAEAALKLATRFQMKTVDRDGVPTPGRTIVIPIRYKGWGG